jgi:hypothetical protein
MIRGTARKLVAWYVIPTANQELGNCGDLRAWIAGLWRMTMAAETGVSAFGTANPTQ